jgi:hypothetical protein
MTLHACTIRRRAAIQGESNMPTPEGWPTEAEQWYALEQQRKATQQAGGQYYGPPEHPKATLALWLGILSLVLCSLLGPIAWWVGARAVKEIDASGGRLRGRGRAQAGKICGVFATVLMIFVAIMVVWAAEVEMLNR